VTISSTHVSSRRRAAILSYESSRLSELLRDTPEVRVRVSVGTSVIMPSLRLFAIASRRSEEIWRIAGDLLQRPEGVQQLTTRLPARFNKCPVRLDIALIEDNLVFATEIVTHVKPENVSLQGEPSMVALAGQFLRAIGYGVTPGGLYAR
jgi:hypothetical protein